MLRKRASCSILPDHESPEVRANLRRVLLLSDAARCNADYEFLDRFTHRANYFSDMPPRERLRYLKAAKGIELEDGDALFRIGDLADAFYCIMYGAMSVVMDFARMPAPTLNEFEEIVNRARVHSSFLNPGGTLDTSQEASYVVRTMKPLECFGDVGMLLTNQQRTASVVATEKTLLMKIDRETFLEMRASNTSRELREKMVFLARVPCVDHWDDDSILRLCGRMEKVVASYNDIVAAQGEPANYFYFVAHGDCRLVREYQLPLSGPALSPRSSPSKPPRRPKTFVVEICSVGSPQFFGGYEVVYGLGESAFSVLVSSPTTVLFRVDRVDFRQTMLKDPQTEQWVRADARALADRMDARKVLQELDGEAKWRQYKRELVDCILVKHQQTHVPPMGPRPSMATAHRTAREPPLPFLPQATKQRVATGSLTAREAGSALGKASTSSLCSPLKTTSASSSSSYNISERRPTIDPDMLPKRSPRPPRSTARAGDKKWIEASTTCAAVCLSDDETVEMLTLVGVVMHKWARKRAEAIVTGQGGRRIDDPDDGDSSAPVSNVRWGKTAQIMGGLESDHDKVASAIVALFSHRDDGQV